MRILITGGFGYLGSILGKSLLGKSNEIILGSRKKQKIPKWLPLAKTAKIDYFNDYSLKTACEGIDCVIHAAGVKAKKCEKDLIGSIEKYGQATKRLLVQSEKSGVKNFIYLSSIHVYKNFLIGQIDEKTKTKNNHPYAKSKLAGERAIINNLKNIDSMRANILRISNVVASPINYKNKCWELVNNDLCRQVITNSGVIYIKSPPTIVRDYVSEHHFKNLIKYCVQNKNNKLITNVCSGKSISLEDLAKIIVKRSKITLNKKVLIKFKSKIIGNKEKLHILSNYSKLDKNNYLYKSIDQTLLFCKKNFNHLN